MTLNITRSKVHHISAWGSSLNRVDESLTIRRTKPLFVTNELFVLLSYQTDESLWIHHICFTSVPEWSLTFHLIMLHNEPFFEIHVHGCQKWEMHWMTLNIKMLKIPCIQCLIYIALEPLQRMTSKSPWIQRYLYKCSWVPNFNLFCSTEPFLSYVPFWDNCTKWLQNDLEHHHISSTPCSPNAQPSSGEVGKGNRPEPTEEEETRIRMRGQEDQTHRTESRILDVNSSRKYRIPSSPMICEAVIRHIDRERFIGPKWVAVSGIGSV